MHLMCFQQRILVVCLKAFPHLQNEHWYNPSKIPMSALCKPASPYLPPAVFGQLVDPCNQFLVLAVNQVIPCSQRIIKTIDISLPPQNPPGNTFPSPGFPSDYSVTENWSLPTLHSGHNQSSGRSSKAVPGLIPLSGSPSSGS